LLQIFDKSVQDTFNATIKAFDGRVNYLGKEEMGFVSQNRLQHALSVRSKPWNIGLY
jgi:hypothetical protein